MAGRYHFEFHGPDTAIVEHPAGPWPRWEMARQAAIAHLQEHLAECQATLEVLRRSPCFIEYMLLGEEMVGAEADG